MEYGTSDVAWTDENLAEWTPGGSPTLADGVVTISGGNGSYATSKTIAPVAYSIINVQAVWRAASSTGRTFVQGNGSYFRFGNIIVAQNDHDKAHGYGFTGLDDIASVTTFTAGSYRVDVTNSTWLLIEAEINTASNTLTSFTIKSEDGNTTYVSASDVALSNADYTVVAFGYRKSGSVSSTNVEQLKSVKITQSIQTVETADYIVKYVCGDTEVKEAVTRTGVVGQDIFLPPSDTENFYANDQKYIYVSSDVEGKTVEEGAVVTITFREAEKYAWTVKSSVGNYTISGEDFEGDKASAKYPLYVLVDGTLWTKATAGNASYVVSFDVTEDNQEFTIDYTETDITDVVFLTEMEDVEGMGIVNSGNAEARSSQRAAGYSISGNTKFTTLPQGKYKMTARFYSPTSSGGNFTFYSGDRSIFEMVTGNANATDATSEEFVLAKDANDILLGQCYATAAVDFVYIQYLGVPTNEELAAAIAEEYAASLAVLKAQVGEFLPLIKKFFDTFDQGVATALASDFTAVETALEGTSIEDINTALDNLKNNAQAYAMQDIMKVKEYISAMDNDELDTMMKTIENKAVSILIGGGDIFEILPDAQQLADAFKAAAPVYLVSVKATAETEGYTNVLNLITEAEKVLANENSDIITIGEAINNVISAMNVATGISTVDAATQSTVIFNIQGQRVAAPVKGVNIINGRKVVIK